MIFLTFSLLIYYYYCPAKIKIHIRYFYFKSDRLSGYAV
jgi:hypothetical protein